MSNEPPELDRETAEQLIGAVTGGLRPELDPELNPVAELLSAAAAPAYPDELTGMDAALTAFRQGRRPTRGHRIRGRVLSVQAAVATLTIAVLGGVALAAATGTLPTAPTTDQPAGTESPALGRTAPSVTPGGPRAGRLSPPAAKPSPPHQALIDLCRVHGAGTKTNPPRPLVDAAGGVSEVPAYCATLLRVRPSGRARTPNAQSPNAHTPNAKTPNGRDRPKARGNPPAPAKSKSR